VKVGTVREIKVEEYRVGLTPEGVRDLSRLGHIAFVEAGAGVGSGYSDAAYATAGATIVPDAAGVWQQVDLMVKVKEPQPQEFPLLRRDLTLFTYLHLAAAPEVTRALLKAGTTAIAYETVELSDGSLPLLTPMSQIAGRMAPQVAARWLQHPGPGRGKLLSGLPGSPPAEVVLFGAGTVALNACEVAVALGAHVTVLAPRLDQLRAMEDRWPGRLTTLPSSLANVERAIVGADVLISGVLVHGGSEAPQLVSREDLRSVGAGAVIVDVAIDQGGIFETSRPTTHADPVYVEEDVIHYCVANMPGAVPRSSTAALTAATLAYVLKLAARGTELALAEDQALAKGLMTRGGELVNKDVAESLAN
jgi:alanine dehydrogenase